MNITNIKFITTEYVIFVLFSIFGSTKKFWN